MNEELTWRAFLANLISVTRERQRLADAIGINPMTLQRWASGTPVPRPEKLRALLDNLPQHYRKKLSDLIIKEFPEFFHNGALIEDIPRDIPSAFYERVFRTFANHTRSQRSSVMSTLILQHMLSHLDPHLQGMAVSLATCVTPQPGQKVRSLRQTQGRGNAPWDSYLKNFTMFFGAESPAGYAMAKHHMVSAQTPEEIQRIFPHYTFDFEQSIVACPIFQHHYMAGSLVIASTQQEYFTQWKLDIIQQYAEVMTLTFEHTQFFTLDDVELEIMPPASFQLPRLAHFQTRVQQLMIESKTQHSYLLRPEAELHVWQHMEQEFLDAPWNDEIAE